MKTVRMTPKHRVKTCSCLRIRRLNRGRWKLAHQKRQGLPHVSVGDFVLGGFDLQGARSLGLFRLVALILVLAYPIRAARYSRRTISINSATDVAAASFSYVILPCCINTMRSARSRVCA